MWLYQLCQWYSHVEMRNWWFSHVEMRDCCSMAGGLGPEVTDPFGLEQQICDLEQGLTFLGRRTLLAHQLNAMNVLVTNTRGDPQLTKASSKGRAGHSIENLKTLSIGRH